MYIWPGLTACDTRNTSTNTVTIKIVYFLETVTSFPQLLHGFDDAELMSNFCNVGIHSCWQCGHKCFIYLFAFEQIASRLASAVDNARRGLASRLHVLLIWHF
jgi:hypothetical protein